MPCMQLRMSAVLCAPCSRACLCCAEWGGRRDVVLAIQTLSRCGARALARRTKTCYGFHGLEAPMVGAFIKHITRSTEAPTRTLELNLASVLHKPLTYPVLEARSTIYLKRYSF